MSDVACSLCSCVQEPTVDADPQRRVGLQRRVVGALPPRAQPRREQHAGVSSGDGCLRQFGACVAMAGVGGLGAGARSDEGRASHRCAVRSVAVRLTCD